MKDLTLYSFFKEISSLSPLIGEYEVSIASLCIYINLLQKNTSNSITRNSNDNKQALEKFAGILSENEKNISDKFEMSNDFIKNYMIVMKLPKTNEHEIKKYEDLLNELNIKRVKELLAIINYSSNIISNYEQCKNILKSEYSSSNKLCISNIQNINNYLKDTILTAISEVNDDEFVFDTLQKLKNM